ncbi:hypothetical protein BDA96_09G260600 [Sorghum bicolor]|uniref:Uncharacterized protein n=1 Tax=Sorghum bicolor TaxID=4558 RepID=A0A921QFB1_SORBI|nr:hypothetical protein BDA96_09G260600 [Sorghum bicolor]
MVQRFQGKNADRRRRWASNGCQSLRGGSRSAGGRSRAWRGRRRTRSPTAGGRRRSRTGGGGNRRAGGRRRPRASAGAARWTARGRAPPTAATTADRPSPRVFWPPPSPSSSAATPASSRRPWVGGATDQDQLVLPLRTSSLLQPDPVLDQTLAGYACQGYSVQCPELFMLEAVS